MNVTHEMLESSPHQVRLHPQKFYDCIESSFECASACWICADACLNEKDYQDLQECVRNCLTCAEVCAATARSLISQSDGNLRPILSQLRNCINACDEAHSECQKHADQHEHCLICAKCCEQCLRICESYVKDLEAFVA